MKFKSLLLCVAALLTLSAAPFAQAQAPEPKVGVDYAAYTPPQPTDTPGKIEVSEFFAYSCSHCHDADPLINKWAKGLPKDVVLRRVPVIFQPGSAFLAGAKAYYTFEAMGLLDKLHADFFDAIHKDRLKFTDKDAVFAWVATKGVDAKKFAEVYNSFGVDSKAQRADQLTRSHNINGTPTMTVNGRYIVNNQLEHARQLQVVDYLVAKIRAEQKK